jgi:hypothetical protein
MTLEEQTRNFLNDALISIPLARGSGTAEEYLDALLHGILCFPVFMGWPSPVDEWLNEAERLSGQLADGERRALVLIRRAGVMMRRLELDEALAELERARALCSRGSPCQAREALTRARVHTRQHQFDRARQSLDEAFIKSGDEHWALALVARGELQLEMNLDEAAATLKAALGHLPPELVEERIQMLQCLAFTAIAKMDAKSALSYLDRARQMLRGAGAWNEVAQMNLVVGSFELSHGRIPAAETALAEALQICGQYPQPALEAALRLGLARLRAAGSDVESALAEALRAAQLYAQQGNSLGYVGVISYLHTLYLQEHNYVEAYRTLATGLSIAKHLKLPVAENILRAQVNRMRDETLGPAKFDEMARIMIEQMRHTQEPRT